MLQFGCHSQFLHRRLDWNKKDDLEIYSLGRNLQVYLFSPFKLTHYQAIRPSVERHYKAGEGRSGELVGYVRLTPVPSHRSITVFDISDHRADSPFLLLGASW